MKPIALIAVAALALTYYLWSPNLDASWGLIDDHEILNMLGPDQRIGFSEIPSFLKSTEAGLPGKSVRYRPGYFLARPIEGWLWGANPQRWYLSRFLMYAISLGIAMWLAARITHVWLGIAFGLWLATGAYWANIWARLGPAETYATFGVALFCLGFVLAPRDSAWGLIALGTLLSAGAKENFVILAAPIVYLLWRHHRTRTLTYHGALLGGVSIAFCLFVAGAVGLAVSQTGKDIYEKSVSVSTRSAAVFEFLGRTSTLREGFALALVLCCFAFVFSQRRLLLRVAAVLAICFVVYVSQLYYYGVQWDTASRYAFPGEMLEWIALFVPVAYAIQALVPEPSRTRTLNVLAVAMLLAVWFKGYDPILANVRQNAEFTGKIARAMERARTGLAQRPDAVIVLWSTTLGDFESYFSIRTLLRAQGMQNPIAVWTAPESEYRTTGFPPELAKALLGTVGSMRDGGQGFAPLASMHGSGGCIAIGITSAPPPNPCQDGGILF